MRRLHLRPVKKKPVICGLATRASNNLFSMSLVAVRSRCKLLPSEAKISTSSSKLVVAFSSGSSRSRTWRTRCTISEKTPFVCSSAIFGKVSARERMLLAAKMRLSLLLSAAFRNDLWTIFFDEDVLSMTDATGKHCSLARYATPE